VAKSFVHHLPGDFGGKAGGELQSDKETGITGID
jgi:hypothetical protein